MAGPASLILILVLAVLTALGIVLALAITAGHCRNAAGAAAVYRCANDAGHLDSVTLLPMPFFIQSGVVMNSGNIVIRMVDFTKLIAGRIPGWLAQTNIANSTLVAPSWFHAETYKR